LPSFNRFFSLKSIAPAQCGGFYAKNLQFAVI
jgi:hypothetical protein